MSPTLGAPALAVNAGHALPLHASPASPGGSSSHRRSQISVLIAAPVP